MVPTLPAKVTATCVQLFALIAGPFKSCGGLPAVLIEKRSALVPPALGVRNIHESMLLPKSKMRAQFWSAVTRTHVAIVKSVTPPTIPAGREATPPVRLSALPAMPALHVCAPAIVPVRPWPEESVSVLPVALLAWYHARKLFTTLIVALSDPTPGAFAVTVTEPAVLAAVKTPVELTLPAPLLRLHATEVARG